MSIKDNIKKVRDNVYEVPGSVNKKMRASGRLYLDDESFEALEETLGKLKLEEPLFITHVAKKSFADTIFSTVQKNNDRKKLKRLKN